MAEVREIPQKQLPTPPPSIPNPAPALRETSPEIGEHLPFLVCNLGNKLVIPHTATRAVLAGRVAYYLVDETGVSLHQPKHIFAALKLDREAIRHFEDYICVGAHKRTLDRKPETRKGLGYRRHYLSDYMITRGVYVSQKETKD